MTDVLAETKAMLREHEGFQDRMYKCPAGKWTIGYGFNLESERMPRAVAELWLDLKIDEIVRQCEQYFPFWDNLTDTRKAVLIDMAYNLGFTGLLTFSKMLKSIETGDYAKAASEMIFSKWYRQVGNRSKRLVKLMRGA